MHKRISALTCQSKETELTCHQCERHATKGIRLFCQTAAQLLVLLGFAITTNAEEPKAFKHNGLPDKVTVDKSGSNKAALDYFNKELKKESQYEIRQIKYLNNIVEQDHRFVKKRTKPMLGFKNFYSAKETIPGIENIRIIQKGQINGQKQNQSAFNNFAELMA